MQIHRPLILASTLLGLVPVAAVSQPATLSAVEQELSAAPPPVSARAATSEIDEAVRARDYGRAARLLAAAIARQPTSRDLLIRIASVFMLDRKPLNAAIALKKAEALGPLDHRARLQLALAYIAMRRGDWARPELDRLAAAEPDNAIYPYWLARLDYDAGQYAVATRRLQDVVARTPDFARAHDNLGLCFEALNRPEDAIVHYREAVRLNRGDSSPSPWPALNLAILLQTRMELDEAETLLREALTYDRRLAQAHYELGKVLEQRGRLPDAIAALKQAIASNGDYAEPYYALSRIYRRQGNTARADAALKSFERLRESQRATRETREITR